MGCLLAMLVFLLGFGIAGVWLACWLFRILLVCLYALLGGKEYDL